MAESPPKSLEAQSQLEYRTHCEAWAAAFEEPVATPAPVSEPEQSAIPEALIPVPLAELGLESQPKVAAPSEPLKKTARRRLDLIGPAIYLASLAVIAVIFLASTWRFIRVQSSIAKNRQSEIPALASLRPDKQGKRHKQEKEEKQERPAELPAPVKVQAPPPPPASAEIPPPETVQAPAPPKSADLPAPQPVEAPAPHEVSSVATTPRTRHYEEQEAEVAPFNLESVIRNELAQDGFQNVGVSTSLDGDVFLHGNLSDPSQEEEVIAVVKGIPGVGQIHFVGTVLVDEPEQTPDSAAKKIAPGDSHGKTESDLGGSARKSKD